MERPIVIVGGGPSGLGAAYELSRSGLPVLVLETLPQVGGLSRTMQRRGLRYDVGPHRFYTKSREVLRLWHDILQDKLLSVNRLTRIFHEDTFFKYPLEIMDALSGLGALESCRIVGSYLLAQWQQMWAPQPIKNFEDWVVNQFGRRLFEIFFKVYSEKVWGIPCQSIGAEWAGQRIKGLNLYTAVWNVLVKHNQSRPRTLADQFFYPRLGAGQFYEKLAAHVVASGGEVLVGHKSVALYHEQGRVRGVVAQDNQGHRLEIDAQAVISSAPLTETIQTLIPTAPPEILGHAAKLRFRGHIGVHLALERRLFPDQWIYVHSKALRMARIADYCNFSPDMSTVPGCGGVTVEYFVFPGEGLWQASDADLLILAQQELGQCGQFSQKKIVDGFVVRHPHAYPLIELGYASHLQIIQAYVDRIEGLQVIGRGGMFRYNNQDHALLSGLLAARNILGPEVDIWNINSDAEYLEEGQAISIAKT